MAFHRQSPVLQSRQGPPLGRGLAEQLNLQCTDGTAAAECVPECSEGYHGYLMLLNIDGDDSKLSCELQHGYYSWVGAAVWKPLLSPDQNLLPDRSFCD